MTKSAIDHQPTLNPEEFPYVFRGKTWTLYGKGKDENRGVMFRILEKLLDDLDKDESVKEWVGSCMAVHINPVDVSKNSSTHPSTPKP